MPNEQHPLIAGVFLLNTFSIYPPLTYSLTRLNNYLFLEAISHIVL